MELRHLRYFLAVAEELHFARAAEKLHIEQSPLSRAIKELEEELGVKLLARTTRRTKLTHAGALFLEHVRRVLTALQQARESVQTVAKGCCATHWFCAIHRCTKAMPSMLSGCSVVRTGSRWLRSGSPLVI